MMSPLRLETMACKNVSHVIETTSLLQEQHEIGTTPTQQTY